MKRRCWNTHGVTGLSNSPETYRYLNTVSVRPPLTNVISIACDILLTQPKLQNEVHQLPKITSQAVLPPSGASWVAPAGSGVLGIFESSFFSTEGNSDSGPWWMCSTQ